MQLTPSCNLCPVNFLTDFNLDFKLIWLSI